jgi:hypothetical protein
MRERQSNLVQFQGRFELHEVAVGLRTRSVEFGWEETVGTEGYAVHSVNLCKSRASILMKSLIK